MREIKFRAWLPEKSKMVLVARLTLDSLKGQRIEHSFSSGISTQFSEAGNIYEHTEIADKFDLMQFTGLKDINGKEIYEGDYLRVRSQYETEEPIDSQPNEVYFKEGSFRCGYLDTILNERFCNGQVSNWNVEVIGNKYEPSAMEAV